MTSWLGFSITLGFLYTASAQPCAPDEIANSGGSCSCNLTKYSITATPPTIDLKCLSGLMTLSVGKCQLEKNSYNSANVHLTNPSCVGTRVVGAISKISVNTATTNGICGNTLFVNVTHATYSNHLIIPASSIGGLVSKKDINYAVSCSYPLKMSATLVTVLKPVVGSSNILLPGGVGSVTATMTVYQSPDFTNPYTQSSVPFNVNDPMYIGVEIPTLSGDIFSVEVTRLYAKGSNDSTDTTTYELITGGCPSPGLGSLVIVNKNGQGIEARFQISVFKITSSNSVFLFAEVQICENTCTPGCGGVRLISEVKSGGLGQLDGGPYLADDTGTASGASDRFSWSWTMNSLLLSLLGLRLL